MKRKNEIVIWDCNLRQTKCMQVFLNLYEHVTTRLLSIDLELYLSQMNMWAVPSGDPDSVG